MYRLFLITWLVFGSVITLSAQSKNESWLHRQSKTVQEHLDSALYKKVDTSYIEVPKKAWRVILRPKANQLYTTLKSSFDDELLSKLSQTYSYNFSSADISWNMIVNQPVSTSVGVWVGYRGLGVGYSQSLTKNSGRHFSLSSTGANYGLSFSLRRFSTDDVTMNIHEDLGDRVFDIQDSYPSNAPIWIRSVFLDGYYVFRGKRYSQAAAYNQSVIQRRSAGSFLLGLSWYQSSVDLSDKLNGDIILAANNVGKMKIHQANIGIGYGYNWVPARNWLVNVMAMPTVSVYNRVKITKYESNYAYYIRDDVSDDGYGTWNEETKQWSNGRSKKPLPVDENDKSWQKDVDIWETGTETKNTRLKLNINGRAGVTYFGKDWFASIYGQIHRFSYDHEETGVRLYDWYVNGSIGIRF